MKQIILCIVIINMVIGCGRRAVSEELTEADSLIMAEKNDSAYQLLSGINERNLVSDEDKAYYYLLLTQACYKTNRDTPSDSCIDYSISYYEHNVDNRKLADAYYYKGCLHYIKKEYVEAMYHYKKAEQWADKSRDLRQLFKISEAIAYLNGLSGNNNMKLQYSLKAMNLAEALRDSAIIASTYYRVYNAFSLIEEDDSAYFYAKKIIPYLNKAKQEDLPYFLTIVGDAYKDNDTSKAKYYYEQALSHKDIISALESLADINYEDGEKDEAYRLWKRALSINDGTPKDIIIYNILEYDIQHGNTNDVLMKVNDIIDSNDSVLNKLKNDTLKDLQLRFDHEVEKHELDLKLNRSLWAIAGLIALVIAIVIYVLFKRYQQRLLWTQTQIQIDNYTTQIRRYEESGADVKEKIEELQAKIDAIMEDKSQKLNRGLKLYNDVNNNESMIRWSKEDYDMFIDYFDVINHPIVKKHRKEHKKLTPRTLTFLLLCSMGKSDEDIRQIMALSPEGLRSMRFRLNHNSN